ncbi:MAG: hypothetical protein A2033_12345 [Bacteroidetes bacterium GWA2_31_9]|nr:MAG: hypothetical protein A2033_12345 [Bacteroidetes bacterium GWA2_31_9]
MNFYNIKVKATNNSWLFYLKSGFKFLILGTVLLFSLNSFSATLKDTIDIKTINVKTDIVSNNIFGAELEINANLKYFNEIKKTNKPNSLIFRIIIFDSNNKPILATESTTFKKNDNQVAISQEFYNENNRYKIIIPYYSLKLEQGIHKLSISIKAFVRDTSITDKPREIFCKGFTKKQITITKPPTKTFKLLVQGVKITKLDSKDSSWDWTGGLADVFYKISLNSSSYSDLIFSSSVVKNTQSAAWMDYSKYITISENDKITIGIFDEDTMFHDIIGEKNFTYEDLLSISDSETELTFGQVTFMILKVKK